MIEKYFYGWNKIHPETIWHGPYALASPITRRALQVMFSFPYERKFS